MTRKTIRSGEAVVKWLTYCTVVVIIIVPVIAAPAAPAADALEEIYILRSIREQQDPTAGWCDVSRTGFTPFDTDAERYFSFWSTHSLNTDGMIEDMHHTRVAELRGCFGPSDDPARHNFHAEIKLGTLAFHGNGECRAVAINFPETGLFPVHCHLLLGGLPSPYVGGLLTTNTIASGNAFGGDTDPPGYTQASIATIRLWKARPVQ